MVLAQATSVDLSPLLSQVTIYVNAVVPIGVLFLIGWLSKKFGVQEFTQNTAFHNALQRAVQYGLNAAEGALPGKNLNVPIANEVLRHALQYAVQYAPELISKHGASPGDVVKLLLSHLPTIEGAITADDINAIVTAALNKGQLQGPAPTLVTTPAPK